MATVRSVGLKKQEPIEVQDDNESDSELEALRIAALQTIRPKSPPHAIPYISSQSSSFVTSPPVIAKRKKKGFRRYNKPQPLLTNPNLISIVPINTTDDVSISPKNVYQRSRGAKCQDESQNQVDSLPLPQNRYCHLLKQTAKEKKKEVSTKFSRIDASDSESDDDDLLKGRFSSDEEEDKPKKDINNSNANTELNDNENSRPIEDDDEDSLDRLMDVMEQEFSEKPKKVPIVIKNVKDSELQNDLGITIKQEIPDDYENVVPEPETIIYKAKKIKQEKLDDDYVENVLLAHGTEENTFVPTNEQNNSVALTLQDPLPTFRKLSGTGLKKGMVAGKKVLGNIINKEISTSSVVPSLKIRSPCEVNLKFTSKGAAQDTGTTASHSKNVYVNILSDENSLSNTESIVKTEIITDEVSVQENRKSPSPVKNSQVSVSSKTENTNSSLHVGNEGNIRVSDDNVNEDISLQPKSRATRSRSREIIQMRRSISPRRRDLSPRYDSPPRTRRSPSRDRSFSPRPARGPLRRSYTPRRSRSPLSYPKSPLRYKRYSRSRSPLRRRSRSWSRSRSPYSRSRSRSRSPYLRYRSRSPYRRSVSRSPRPAGRYPSPRRVLSPRKNSLSPVRRDYLPLRRYSPGRRKSISPRRRSPFYYRQGSPTFISRGPNRLSPSPRLRNSSLSPNRRSPPSQSIRRSISPRRPAKTYDSYSPKRARLSISPVSRQRRTVSPRKRISPLRSVRNSISPNRQFSPGRSPKRLSVSPWRRAVVSPRRKPLLSPRKRSPLSPRKRSPSPRRRPLRSPVRRVNRSPLPPYKKRSVSPFSSRKRSLSPFATQLPTSAQLSNERGSGHQKEVRDRIQPATYREPRKNSPISRSTNSQRNAASPVLKRTSVSPKRIDKDPKGASVSPRRTSDTHTRHRSGTPTGSPKRNSPKRNASPSSNKRSVSPATDKNPQRKSSPLVVRYNKPTFGEQRRLYQHRNAHRAHDFRGAARSRSRSRSISPTSRKDTNTERSGPPYFGRQNYNQRRRKVVDDRNSKIRDNRRRERRSRDRSDRDKTRDKKENRDKTRDRGRPHVNQKEKDEQENNEENKTKKQPIEEKNAISDPVLEARRRKFQSNNPVQPLNKKIRLKTWTNEDSSPVITASDKSTDKIEKVRGVSKGTKESTNDCSFKKAFVESTTEDKEVAHLTIMKADSSEHDVKFSPKMSRAESNKSLDKACNTDDVEEEFEGDSLLLMADDELELEEHAAVVEPPKQAKPPKFVAEKRNEPEKKEKKKVKAVKPMARPSAVVDKACSPLASGHKEVHVGTRKSKDEKKAVTSSSDSKEECDLRAELCRRRAERLTKAGSVHESLPKRLLQSAFVGLIGEKKRLNTKEKVRTSGTQLQSQVHLQTARNTQSMRSDKVAVPEGGKRRVLLVNRPSTRKAAVKISFPKGFESQSDSGDEDNESYNEGDNSDAQEDNSDAIDNEMESPDESSVVLNSRKKSKSSMRIPIRFRLGVTTDVGSRRRQQVRRMKQVGRFPSIDLDLHGTPPGREIQIDVTTFG